MPIFEIVEPITLEEVIQATCRRAPQISFQVRSGRVFVMVGGLGVGELRLNPRAAPANGPALAKLT